MGKFNATVYQLPANMNIKLEDSCKYTPCVAGEEESIGVTDVWHAGGQQWTFIDILCEKRKVPQKWLDAEIKRRISPGLSMEIQQSMRENIKQELWGKIAPELNDGYVAYHRTSGLAVVMFSPRKAHKLLQIVLGALEGKPEDCITRRAYDPIAFDEMVRQMIRGNFDYSTALALGGNVVFSEGSGGSRKLIEFRNYMALEGDTHVAEVMNRCKMVASCGFVYDGLKDDKDDFTATPHGALSILDPSSGSDDAAAVLLRAERVRHLVNLLAEESAPFVPEDSGEEVVS